MKSDPSFEQPARAIPAWLEPLDHTADSGIIVRARDQEELFARAAWGMFSIITDLNAVQPAQSEIIVVTALDRESLLVRWLSELNFQHATRHQLFCCFDILELSDDRVVAEVSGEAFAADRHAIYTEIKAVTFHGLHLEQGPAGWRAQVIFDL
jgi:SHS2 domain-containing protein